STSTTGCSSPTPSGGTWGATRFGISALDIKALYLGRHLGKVDAMEAWADTRRVQMLRRHPVDLPHTHRALDDAREQAALCRAILASARRRA
ncbi:MAG TPA: hypothetical protein VIR16_06000, partial [Candidatus Limnocylindrales bacterium]